MPSVQKKRELVSTFVAADNAGRKVLVQHYRELMLQVDAEGEKWSPTGKIILVTEDGRDVKRKAKGDYEISSIRGPAALHSDDPDAP
jgi:hypothetical protein